tara:strand:+ start:2424 stop:2801 length:378 start_codon:yes stop_codon:yes gene_type:complete
VRPILPIFALCLALQCCGESEPPPSLTELRADAPILTIKVLADGSILADDAPTTLDTLNTQLPEIAEAHGLVWFYRDHPNASPQPAATDALRLILDHELPVCLATRPDFIDIIEEEADLATDTTP